MFLIFKEYGLNIDYNELMKSLEGAKVDYLMIELKADFSNITHSEEDLVDIAHMYSKDVEHSDENIEALQEVFETRDIFDSDEIIATILN